APITRRTVRGPRRARDGCSRRPGPDRGEDSMSAKAIVSGALVLAVLGGLTARTAAQPPAPPAGQPEVLPPPVAPPTSPLPDVIPPPSQAPAANAGLPPGTVPDPWITYTRPGCCGPIGGNGPVGWEYFLRTGLSIPTGPGIVAESLNAGWRTEIGARSLFFNPANTTAWTTEMGLSYTYNDAGGPNRQFTLNVPFLVSTF